MSAFNQFAVVLGLALASAHAHAVDFSFTSGSSLVDASYTATVDGLILTASAWSDTAKGNKLEVARLSLAPGVAGGMGVCNTAEQCTPGDPLDALSNKVAQDLILFSFSTSVTLQSLTVLQVGLDSDLSMWAGTGAPSLAGLKVNGLPTAAPFGNTDPAQAIRNVSLNTLVGTYDWLAVAARANQKDDLLKLQSLLVTPVARPVPEADTWVMLLAGLGLVGFAVMRRSRD